MTPPGAGAPEVPLQIMPLDELRDRLQIYLRRELDRRNLDLSSVRPIAEGHSGFTFFVTAAEGGWAQDMVLRLPPPGANLRGPSDVVRQGRIMSALRRAGLPTPSIVANCADPAVLDGRPFCLMLAMPGMRVDKALEHSSAKQVVEAAIRALKRIHSVPLGQCGIGDEQPTSLLGELMRWEWLMQRAPADLTARAPLLRAALEARRPSEPSTTVVHGDYHYGNLLFDRDGAGTLEVVAVFDWEIAELGAPMLDVGCLCVFAQTHAGHPAFSGLSGGLELGADDIFGIYGPDRTESRWYLAVSDYKYAAIFGYNLMLHRRGRRADPLYEDLTGVIRELIESGLENVS